MLNTYLSLRFYIIFCLASVGSVYFVGNKLIPVLLLLLVVFVFLFRKRSPLVGFLGKYEGDHNLLRSPINGYVKKIVSLKKSETDQHTYIIHFLLPPFMEMGLYMPMMGEIDEVRETKGFSFFRYNNREDLTQRLASEKIYRNQIKVKGTSSDELIIRVIKCFLGLSPKLWVQQGDYGKTGASFGFLPFGGTVLLYLSKDIEILVKEGNWVVGGQTIIAKRKAFNE